MLQKLDWYWNPLLEASWELLGLSWGALGPLLGTLGEPKWCPRGDNHWSKTVFFATLSCIIYCFRFLLPLGASGAYLGRVLDPLGPLLGGFLPLWGPSWAGLRKKLPGFLVSLPFFVFTYCGSPVIWSPLKLFHPLCPFNPLTNISNISNIPNIPNISIMSNIPAWRNARSV